MRRSVPEQRRARKRSVFFGGILIPRFAGDATVGIFAAQLLVSTHLPFTILVATQFICCSSATIQYLRYEVV